MSTPVYQGTSWDRNKPSGKNTTDEWTTVGTPGPYTGPSLVNLPGGSGIGTDIEKLKGMRREMPTYYTEEMFNLPTIDTSRYQQAARRMAKQGYGGYGSALARLSKYAAGEDSVVDEQQRQAAANIRQQLASAAATGGYDPAKQRGAMYGTGEALASLGAQSEIAKMQEQQAANQMLAQMGLSGAQTGTSQALQQKLADYQTQVAAQKSQQDYAGKQTAYDLALLDYIQGLSTAQAQREFANRPQGLDRIFFWNW